MGFLKDHAPVKLLIGMITASPELFQMVRPVLTARFGPIDFESPVYDWNHTDYYEDELGTELKRQFLFFKQALSPDALPKIKQFTNELEQRWIRKRDGTSLRKINIDPGYLAPSKLVLATTKDYSHRIYLGDGIYAEVTLVFRGKSFIPLDHTYPDFRSGEYIRLFNKARSLL